MAETDEVKQVQAGRDRLEGLLGAPENAAGLVIFAHGSGSGRSSPRNNRVAAGLREAGLATLLIDLLKPEEERDRANVFDIELLSSRLEAIAQWARIVPELSHLPIGYFGASTGAAAALVSAAHDKDIAAVVSRGGRPDLAGRALEDVAAPTLLIVGGADTSVIPLNCAAFERLKHDKEMVIVPGAGHLFEEPGTLEQVADHAKRWFVRYLRGKDPQPPEDDVVFRNRQDAGRRLGAALMPLKGQHPVVLALPRGGVPVGFEVAKALDAPLDVVLVRKIGAPFQPELGLGAVMDGRDPELVLNDDVVAMVAPPPGYVEAARERELREIDRRRELYRDGKPMIDIAGRTVVVVDDGVATGGTVRAVLRGLARRGPRKLVLAVPVAPSETLEELSSVADEIVCLSRPAAFLSVGSHYRNFRQTSDAEVVELLQQARPEARLPATTHS